jgi:hypothetical protein
VALPHARPRKGRLLQIHPEATPAPASAAGPPTQANVTSATTDQSVATAYDPYAARRANAVRVEQAIYLLFGVIEGLLVMRFVLRALGANPDAGFAQAVYAITGVLVSPFNGLFGTPQIGSGAALDVATLVALVVYAAIGWFLARAAWLVFGDSRTGSVASVTSAKTRVP